MVDKQTLQADYDFFVRETKYLRWLHLGDLPIIIDARLQRPKEDVIAVIQAIGVHKTWGGDAHHVLLSELKTAWKLAIESAPNA